MPRSKLKGASILIVEDQPLIAMSIAQIFTDAGATVATTTTLKQALVLVENDGLSAAILDHALADGDSSRLCLRLKERDIPFVIYSGYAHLTGACSEAPRIDKPASADVLVTTVAGLLASRPISNEAIADLL